MDVKESKDIFIGIDGGATKTKGVLFDINGNTLSSLTVKGSNLNIYQKIAAQRISRLIKDLIQESNVNIESIRCIGLGIAGSSDQDGRDLLFKELDRINLSNKALLTNDAEAAYQVCCPNNQGLLITVGTGVICLGRKESGELFRSAGKGHHQGDIGSGYWMGLQAIIKLSMNDDICINNPVDSKELLSLVCESLNIIDLDKGIEEVLESTESVREIASLAKEILFLATKQNEVALSIVQEATTSVADYIIELSDKLDYRPENLILAVNGSVIKNAFFRKALHDALQFQFKQVNWIISKVSPAYGAAIVAAKYKNINIKLSDIIDKGVEFEANS